MICWLACVIALSLRSSTKPGKRVAGKRSRIARRVGKVRTRWPCYGKICRVVPFTAVRVGEAAHPGPLSTKHFVCPHCPTWLSHSGTLRKHIQRFHTSRLAPSRVLCAWNFSEADAVEEGRRSRRRGPRSSGARQRRLFRREPKVFGPEEFSFLQSNVRGFISRVAQLSAETILAGIDAIQKRFLRECRRRRARVL